MWIGFGVDLRKAVDWIQQVLLRNVRGPPPDRIWGTVSCAVVFLLCPKSGRSQVNARRNSPPSTLEVAVTIQASSPHPRRPRAEACGGSGEAAGGGVRLNSYAEIIPQIFTSASRRTRQRTTDDRPQTTNDRRQQKGARCRCFVGSAFPSPLAWASWPWSSLPFTLLAVGRGNPHPTCRAGLSPPFSTVSVEKGGRGG